MKAREPATANIWTIAETASSQRIAGNMLCDYKLL